MKDKNREQYEELAFKAILPRLARGMTQKAIENELYPILSQTKTLRPKDVTDILRWLIWWVTSGMPHVIIDAKLTASFMATSIPAEFAHQVPIPWEDFLLTIPANVLSKSEISCIIRKGSRDSEDGTKFVRVIFLDREAAPERENGAMSWNLSEGWSRFADEPQIEKNALDLNGKIIEDTPRRRLKLVLRTIFGACAELSNRVGSGGGSTGAIRSRPADIPSEKLWTIRLSRPVKLDCREYVRDFISGERGSIAVRYMRRGHWRNQPYGPKGSLRKFIHIEPHWVGSEDAPIAVRPHVLGEC